MVIKATALSIFMGPTTKTGQNAIMIHNLIVNVPDIFLDTPADQNAPFSLRSTYEQVTTTITRMSSRSWKTPHLLVKSWNPISLANRFLRRHE